MNEDVVFKGSRDGLLLVFNETIEFESILSQLKAKLESAVNFFTKGTVVQISADHRVLTQDQQVELINLFANYGITLKEAPEYQVPEDEVKKETSIESFQTLVITRTLRGGQEVSHKGSVIIMGDVNPGAKVIAGGDVVVHGACRGIVHAGAFGDINALITADRLLASQIRIANLISRAPDNLDKPERIETARIKDGIIVIGPANI
ncbi:septum site-determining protein MinC [Dendrosporobacter sp. 1207_IL3150]|uniref:septum site-determining protein MinC n=1 Tax=Dendrosporobacter sp. 1207_IL3150 TaxID=3084054 RepID=UPI002FDAA2A1